MAEVDPWPFATVQELRDRWPDMPAGADEHAAIQIEDASQFILDVCPTAADASEGTRRRVVCSVVRRSMESAGVPAGVEQFSQTAGPFQQSFRPTNTGGDFYLTKSERKALGEGRQRAFGVDIAPVVDLARHRPWCSLMFGALYCSCGADLTLAEPLWEA